MFILINPQDLLYLYLFIIFYPLCIISTQWIMTHKKIRLYDKNTIFNLVDLYT